MHHLGRIDFLLIDKEFDVFYLVLSVVNFSFQIYIDLLALILGHSVLADKFLLLLS